MASLLQPLPRGSRGWCYLPQVDPRLRVVVALAMSLVVALAQQTVVLALALATSLLALTLAGLSLRPLLRRLLPLNVVFLVVMLLLPLTKPGAPLLQLGPIHFSAEGLYLAIAIALKGNAIVLTFSALLGSMDASTLGHALSHLYVPAKLTHLMLFTVRYLDVLHQEYRRLRAAMKTRGFRPAINRHTYRTFGYLVGMLLVRSLDRSERIVAAMKCRGFHGRFHLLDHFAFSRRDLPFCLASLTILTGLILLTWLGR